jgi:hypothetical protein
MTKHPPVEFTIRALRRRGYYAVTGVVTMAENIASEDYEQAVKGQHAAEALRRKMILIELEARANAERVQAARHAEAQAIKARRLARKAQDFDTSTLPLFGDGHLQQDLF